MMLHHREHHLVSLVQMALPITLRNEIQRFCCVSGKNNLLVLRRMNKLRYGMSGFFVFSGCIQAPVIQPPQRIGIGILIKLRDCVQHTGRSLRCRGIVEIDVIVFAVKTAFVKNRKIVSVVFHNVFLK